MNGFPRFTPEPADICTTGFVYSGYYTTLVTYTGYYTLGYLGGALHRFATFFFYRLGGGPGCGGSPGPSQNH